MLPDTAPKFRASPVSAAHSPLAAKFMMSQSMTLLLLRVPPSSGEAVRTMRAAGLLLRVLAVVRRGIEVVAEIELQRRLAVAEHVVGRAEARRDVVERVDAWRPREADRRRVELRRQLRPVVLRRAEAPGAVVAQRALQRQPAARPLVLDVQRRRRRAVRLVPLRQPERELIRHALVEPVGQLRLVERGTS